MARRHYQLPALTTLATFETAARKGSFKDAAKELGVTAGAISHQIKNLEEELGILLFNRHYRGVDITKAGKQLFSALEQSFTDISSTLSAIRKTGQLDIVTISATTAFSSLWLTPRLTELWNDCGEISVNQYVSDTPSSQREISDLSIVYGKPEIEPTPFQVSKLFQDELIPVCSPTFINKQPSSSLMELASLPLIHLMAKDDRWTTWHTWFEHLGYKGLITEKIKVNSYMIALQMASEGVGVVLGWKKLLQPLFEYGTLVPLNELMLPAPSAFYLISAREEFLSSNIKKVRACLLKSR